MTIKTPPQVIVNTTNDPGLTKISAADLARIRANGNATATPTSTGNVVNVIQPVTKVITQVYRATAGGVDNQIQINENGVFAGDSGLTYDPNTDTLQTGSLIINGGNVSLGQISKIKILGGYNKQILMTDGTGNISWGNNIPTVSGKANKYLYSNGITTEWVSIEYANIANTPSFPGGNVANLATQSDVSNAIANLIGTAPEIVDTLGEIANVLGNGGNFVVNIYAQLANTATTTDLANLAGNIPNIDGLASNSYVDEKTTWANISGKPDFALVAETGNYSDLNGVPNLSTVATSGQYYDLIGRVQYLTDLGITDGTDGQVLSTDGNGNFTFTSVGGVSLGDWSFSGNTLSIGEDATIKTSTNSGYPYNLNIELYSAETSAHTFTFSSQNGYDEHQGALEMPFGSLYHMWTGPELDQHGMAVQSFSGGDLQIKTDGGNRTWNFGADGVLTVASHILPQRDSSTTIGSAEQTFDDIHVNNVKTKEDLNIDAGSGYSFWASIYGDIEVDNSYTTGVGAAYDSTGNLYVFGRADNDNLALKYHPDGELLWRKSWTVDDGSPCGSFNQEIYVADDKVYFISKGEPDSGNTVAYVGYHDSEGNITTAMTKIDDFYPNDLIVNNGNVYVGGNETIDFVPSVVKLNPETNEVIWSSKLDHGVHSGLTGTYNCIEIGTDNNLYAIGTINDSAVLTEFNSENGSVATTVNLLDGWGTNNYGQAVGYYAGYVFTLVYLNGGFVLSKFDKTALTTDLWSVSNQTDAIEALDISFDGFGYIYLTGSTSAGPTGGDRDFYVAKFSCDTGAVIWSRTFGDNATESDEYLFSSSGTRMAGIYQDRLALTGYTQTNPITGGTSSTYKAMTVQLPIDGSGVGAYDQYALNAMEYSYTTPSITQVVNVLTFTDTLPSYSNNSAFVPDTKLVSPDYYPYRVELKGGGASWNFGRYGDLTVPGDIQGQVGNDLEIAVHNPRDEAGNPGGVTLLFTNNDASVDDPTTRMQLGAGNVEIITDFNGAVTGNSHTWTFKQDGNMTFPSYSPSDDTTYVSPTNVRFTTSDPNAGGYENAYSVTNQTNVSWESYAEDDTSGPNDAWAWIKADLIATDNPEVFIENQPSTTGISKRWTFDKDGAIVFPDDTKQTTAFRNIPLQQMNLDGGAASAIFDINMMFVDGGGSYRRGFSEVYDGSTDSSNSATFTNTLDGGQS